MAGRPAAGWPREPLMALIEDPPQQTRSDDKSDRNLQIVIECLEGKKEFEIADNYGISRERVRQILKRAVRLGNRRLMRQRS